MTHAPPLQAALPLANEQRVPHAPQLFTSAERGVSHPLLAVPSQLPKPALQLAIEHAPLHCGVAFAKAQRVPHAPQLFTSLSATSQPFAGERSQSANPARHAAMEQTPLEQAGVELALLHARPHAPQWAGFALRFVSHPLAALPSQSPYPDAQVNPHEPLQVRVAFAAIGQAVVQLPQWLTSLARLKHAETQRVCPLGHCSMHDVPPQT